MQSFRVPRPVTPALIGWLALAWVGPWAPLQAQEYFWEKETSAAAPITRAQPAPDASATEYHIGPRDLLDIEVFRLDEFSRKVRVNSRGQISLPLIGRIQAAGLTSHQLEAIIAEKLQENYLRDPYVSVFIEEYTSQRVTVEGAVIKPGIYSLKGRTTLLQALAMAEGLDGIADKDDIQVFRTFDDGTKQAYSYDVNAIRRGKAEDPLVHGDDVIVVERSGPLSFIRGVSSTLRGFIGFGTVR